MIFRGAMPLYWSFMFYFYCYVFVRNRIVLGKCLHVFIQIFMEIWSCIMSILQHIKHWDKQGTIHSIVSIKISDPYFFCWRNLPQISLWSFYWPDQRNNKPSLIIVDERANVPSLLVFCNNCDNPVQLDNPKTNTKRKLR